MRVSRAIGKFHEMKKVLSDSSVNMKTRKKLMEACVRSRLTYGTQACFPKEVQMRKLESCWVQNLRCMVKGGWTRQTTLEDDEEENYKYLYRNQEIEQIVGTMPIRNVIEKQYLKFVAHICRSPNTAPNTHKEASFCKSKQTTLP